jgi:cytochrome c553
MPDRKWSKLKPGGGKMRRYAGVLALALIATGAGAMVAAGQDRVADPVAWAYGFVYSGPDPVAPACSVDTKPHDCSWPGRPWPEDGKPLHLPGSERTFTISQVQSFWAPADWYPNEHQPAPDIVKFGHEKDHLRACGHCHYFNGMGKPENAHLAGLPLNYILQQMALFKIGGRKPADPRKANANEMTQIARFLTDEETRQAAEYFSALKWRPWEKVVESETAPRTRQSPAGMFLPLDGGGTEPLGERIIEVPQDTDKTERLRDPHSGFVAYVPIGSLAKGKGIVTTGAGKAIACGMCHGEDLLGTGDVPAIAGRSASYLMRQLYNYQQGTRESPLMKGVVKKLSTDDMISVVSYLASR